MFMSLPDQYVETLPMRWLCQDMDYKDEGSSATSVIMEDVCSDSSSSAKWGHSKSDLTGMLVQRASAAPTLPEP